MSFLSSRLTALMPEYWLRMLHQVFVEALQDASAEAGVAPAITEVMVKALRGLHCTYVPPRGWDQDVTKARTLAETHAHMARSVIETHLTPTEQRAVCVGMRCRLLRLAQGYRELQG